MVAERTEPRVSVFVREGRWAWVYEEDSLRLESNDDFDSAEAALTSVAIAYPDVQDIEVAAANGLESPARLEDRGQVLAEVGRGALLLLAFVALLYLLRHWSHRVGGHG